MKRILPLLLISVLSGCAQLGHRQFYSQVAPTKYPPTSQVMVFEYSNTALDEIYQFLFADFLIIGRSSFNGPYENPARAKYYAKSIGADVFISSSCFKESRTSSVPLTLPSSSTTYASGYAGGSPFYGTATTYGTQTTYVPVRVNRYDQEGMYLKNVNKTIPLWERTKNLYPKDQTGDMDGFWRNESYKIEIYRSGEKCVGFIVDTFKKNTTWSRGQLKLIFDSQVGIYLLGDKTPVPANMRTNKFGHLEIELITSSESFSFEKIPNKSMELTGKTRAD